mgnify:FL=1
MLVAGAGLVTAACAREQAETTASTPTQPAPTTASPTPTAEPTDRWRADNVAPAGVLAAYANDSVMAGQPLQLHVSATAPWRASVYRIGDFGGMGGAKVAEAQGPKQVFGQTTVDPATRMVSAGWPVVAEVDTNGWPSGLYTVVVRTADGGTNIPFVVRPDSARDTVAIIAASAGFDSA